MLIVSVHFFCILFLFYFYLFLCIDKSDGMVDDPMLLSCVKPSISYTNVWLCAPVCVSVCVYVCVCVCVCVCVDLTLERISACERSYETCICFWRCLIVLVIPYEVNWTLKSNIFYLFIHCTAVVLYFFFIFNYNSSSLLFPSICCLLCSEVLRIK